MNDPDFSKPPLNSFAPPGSVIISNEALELARHVVQAAMSFTPDRNWVAVFHWADQRRTREKGTNVWIERGPGVDAGAVEVDQVPAAAVASIEGLKVAIQIPRHIVLASEEKAIVRDDTIFGKIRLR